MRLDLEERDRGNQLVRDKMYAKHLGGFIVVAHRFKNSVGDFPLGVIK